jgi:hypothetical protein
MCETAQFFEDALAENGLDNATVAVNTDDAFNKTVHVRKDIGGEPYAISTTISAHRLSEDRKEKTLALEAREVFEKFRDEMTELFERDGHYIRVNPYDEPEATCKECGETARLPEKISVPAFQESAELSTPVPMPRNRQETINSFDEYERTLVKLYLVGKLNRDCDHHRKI